MHFLEENQIREWCAQHHILLEDGARPTADPALVHTGGKIIFADGARSGREPQVAFACLRTLGSWRECLVWVTLTGVWPSGEDWPTVYAWRGARGERRSLEIAPGCLFGSEEAPELGAFLTQVMENGWDAYVLPTSGVQAPSVRVFISHDEWLEVQGQEPVSIDVAAV